MRLHPAFPGLVVAASIVSGPACAADASGAANIAMVKQFLAEVRIAATSDNAAANVRTVAEGYMAADYTQHAPKFPPGREGYIEVMSKALKPPAGGPDQPPSGQQPGPPKDINFVADGPYVIWVSELPRSNNPADGKRYLFNMFRIEGTKLKEHWDSE